MPGTLKANFIPGDRLYAAQINAMASDLNATATQLDQVALALTADQAVASDLQQTLLAAGQTLTTTGQSVTTLQDAMTAAEGRLTALEIAVTPPPVPNAPTNLIAGTITTTSIAVSASAPSSGPAPTGYIWQYAPAGTGAYTSRPVGPALNVVYTGLTAGLPYDLRVQAVNAAGPGGISVPITRSTNPVFTPSPAWFEIPLNGTTITMNDGAQITVVSGVVMRNPGTGALPLGQSSYVIVALVNSAGVLYQESNHPDLSGLPGGVGWWYYDPNASPVWVYSPSDPRPGSVPIVTGTAREKLIGFLNGVANAGKIIIGQLNHEDDREFDANTAALGFPLGLMINEIWADQWAGNALYAPNFFTRAKAHWDAGGIVGVEANWPNPAAGNGASQDAGNVDPTLVLQTGNTHGNLFRDSLDKAASVLLQYKNAGIPVIWRCFWEFDGAWFWWGYTRMSAAQYIALWRYTYNYLVVTKGLDNLVWMYAPNGGPGPSSEIVNRYPGDGYVDGTGVDAYTSTPLTSYPTVFQTLRGVAPTKFQAFTEYGSGDPGAVDTNFDAFILINGVKTRAWGSLVYIHTWAGWDWYKYRNAAVAASDPIVLNRNNMNRGF